MAVGVNWVLGWQRLTTKKRSLLLQMDAVELQKTVAIDDDDDDDDVAAVVVAVAMVAVAVL